MRKVNLPNNDNALEDLKTALTYKNGDAKYSLSAQELETLDALYKKYDDLKGFADDDFKSINLSDATNNAIHDAYDEVQEKKRLQDLRSRILMSVDRCPYCRILDADELDHHLPQSVYKALSVYSSNLLPMCHKCNNKKRAVPGTDITKRFTHVYFDEFPDFPQLVANVSFINNSLIVKFEIDGSNISELLYQQLSFQIKRINLDGRLKKEWNIYLTSFGISLDNEFSRGNGDSVRGLLIQHYEQNKRTFGHNDWRTALLLGLASCEAFCDGGFKEYYKSVIPNP